ncbi:MAG: UvrD-helicase domain-containing protein [Fimbriimonadia bacterium]
MSKLDLSSLNPKQLEAVMHPGGPLLVFAGAGSGKTRVITYRIARLISDGLRPWNVLAVTFTNKAANEMKERVAALLGEDLQPRWVGTFHSMCSRILRECGERIGIDRNFVVYDDDDQTSVVRDCLRELNLDEKQFTPRSVLTTISRAKEKLISAEQFPDVVHGFFERIVAEVYPKYQARLREYNALDFNDLIFFAVRLLREDRTVLERYRDQFRHVLVDEYQDVNQSQYTLIQLLGGEHENITVVGDDDQSIYGWRGADVKLILRFTSDYPDAKVVTLDQNYRSTQSILDAAHRVIRRNRNRAEKKLWTENAGGSPVTLTMCGTETDEAQVIAETIQREVRAGHRRYGDFAILYRTNAQSRAFEETFLGLRIPHIIIGGTRFYERKEIKDVVAYLRVIHNPYDLKALERIVNVPARGIGPTTLQVLRDHADNAERLWDAMRSDAAIEALGTAARKRVAAFVQLIEDLRQMPLEGPVLPVVEATIRQSGYLDALAADRTEEGRDRVENVREFLTVAGNYDSRAEEPTLAEFLQNIALVSDADFVGERADSVQLLTLHTAKGLEFPVVFLAGLEEGVFPHQRCLDSESQLEEERRLCYVGMTRAQEELNLTYATRRAFRGQTSFNRPSRFLQDLDPDVVTSLGAPIPPAASGLRPGTERHPARPPVVQQQTEAAREPAFAVGQKVRHKKFGLGVVVACVPVGEDSEVTVAFPGIVGIKKLLQRFADLEALG